MRQMFQGGFQHAAGAMQSDFDRVHALAEDLRRFPRRSFLEVAKDDNFPIPCRQGRHGVANREIRLGAIDGLIRGGRRWPGASNPVDKPATA